ncbi:hypothetical protein PsYK624_020020 [Phanerochaete sordida]|uniref:Uncharacterized protein n=1 Tax=Phanerochaete sordida TaxID=48140 RepID=A0A9P3G0L7_9APHY|nr:hypothetical protein PsYK624_020020 [Phanerochaete sordida]
MAQSFEYGSVQWKKAVSSRGVEYEVGTAVDGAGAAGAAVAQSAAQGDDAFDIPVHWTVENKWITLPEDFQKTTGILKYFFGDAGTGPFQYTFRFVIDKVYSYTFGMADGDSYKIHVFSVGEHFMRLNTDGSPVIVRVAGP